MIKIRGSYTPTALKTPAKNRVPVKKQLKECRDKTINEMIKVMKDELRVQPKEWHRAYYSAITHLEEMKNG